MSSVNIPRHIIDPNYRYKMPPIHVKIEGRGGGIKTRLENITQIAKSLERPEEYIIKFFSLTIGTIVKGNLINGKHDPDDLAELLDMFIEKYVLCGQCGNPETEIKVKRERIGLKCRACGFATECDPGHKLSTYIVKHPPPN